MWVFSSSFWQGRGCCHNYLKRKERGCCLHCFESYGRWCCRTTNPLLLVTHSYLFALITHTSTGDIVIHLFKFYSG